MSPVLTPLSFSWCDSPVGLVLLSQKRGCGSMSEKRGEGLNQGQGKYGFPPRLLGNLTPPSPLLHFIRSQWPLTTAGSQIHISHPDFSELQTHEYTSPLSFFFRLHSRPVEVPGPGIKTGPQLQVQLLRNMGSVTCWAMRQSYSCLLDLVHWKCLHVAQSHDLVPCARVCSFCCVLYYSERRCPLSR